MIVGVSTSLKERTFFDNHVMFIDGSTTRRIDALVFFIMHLIFVKLVEEL